MLIRKASLILLLALQAIPGNAWSLTNTFIGSDFYNGFTWETFDDPTHGRVNYVDQATAQSSNLSYAGASNFIIRADSYNVVSGSARGRDSVRIQSTASFGDSVLVLDLAHMPAGCGTWPAFWTTTTGSWPNGGEIDIIEGVNEASSNLASLHTTPGCTMPDGRWMSGSSTAEDCDTSVDSNTGCGVSNNKANSYGTDFNTAGGGWYIMRRSAMLGVSVWFWSRHDTSVPWDISSGAFTLNEYTWGQPVASFPPQHCDMPSHFGTHNIVFDLTFCGDWAGSAYASSGCPGSSCQDHVDNYPGAFTEAYWDINSLRVYQ
ncbi:hypothetical protein P7C73_g2661, partial [Tremellales sp. Uapishka_1]